MLIVQKYGGSSVADAQGIKRVAQRIVATKKAGHEVVTVISAMGDTTDDLRDLAQQVSPLPPPRELDMLLTAGERISMALLAMAIADQGQTAKSYTGSQAGVLTTSQHGNAKIIDITPGRIQQTLDEGSVAIVAGFQGVSQDTKEITTLGRGASDTTAVALAAALNADVCEIFTDVDGVFTADPRIVPTARRIPAVSYAEMLELAACGSKVLHLRCVEYARRYGIPINVRSSFSNKPGTWVADPEVLSRAIASGADVPTWHGSSRRMPAPNPSSRPAVSQSGGVAHDEQRDPNVVEAQMGASPVLEGEETMEQPIIAGVAHDRSEAKITVVAVPDKVGEAARIFTTLASADINLDMIVQNVSGVATGRTDISFTLPRADGQKAMSALARIKESVGFEQLLYDDRVGKVSLVGAGMRTNPGVAARFFACLADAGVNLEMISTSEIRVSVVVDEDDIDTAVAAAHHEFDLDADQVEAVVYGGTGR